MTRPQASASSSPRPGRPTTGNYKPITFMAYRINGQYIMEGLEGGMMYSLGGEEWGRRGGRGRSHPRRSTIRLPTKPPSHFPQNKPTQGLGLIMLDIAHRKDMSIKYRKILLGM